MARPQIALTFDDGPSNVTERVLDVLEKAGAKATFFVLGERVALHAPQLRRMVANELQIGNHTWSHNCISGIGEDELRGTLARTDDAIRQACGVTSEAMRPPGGVCSDAALSVLTEMGLPAVFWNVDPRDWETQDAQKTIDHVLDKAADGRIVIMHDIYESTADAVETLVPELVSRGFSLVTVHELAEGRGGMQLGERHYGFKRDVHPG